MGIFTKASDNVDRIRKELLVLKFNCQLLYSWQFIKKIIMFNKINKKKDELDKAKKELKNLYK